MVARIEEFNFNIGIFLIFGNSNPVSSEIKKFLFSFSKILEPGSENLKFFIFLNSSLFWLGGEITKQTVGFN